MGGDKLKRLLGSGILLLLLLAACGNQLNENIDETMAESTNQILDIFDKAIREERSLTDDELFVVDDYQLLYGAKEKIDALTEEESRLFILVRNMTDMSDTLILVSSNHNSYESQKNLINDTLYDNE